MSGNKHFKDFSKAERLALQAAESLMSELGWAEMPIAILYSIELLAKEPGYCHLMIEFLPPKEPGRVFKILVNLRFHEGAWVGGSILALHGDVRETYHVAKFKVLEGLIPTISITEAVAMDEHGLNQFNIHGNSKVPITNLQEGILELRHEGFKLDLLVHSNSGITQRASIDSMVIDWILEDIRISNAADRSEWEINVRSGNIADIQCFEKADSVRIFFTHGDLVIVDKERLKDALQQLVAKNRN